MTEERHRIRQTDPLTSSAFQAAYAGENTFFVEPSANQEATQNLLPESKKYGQKKDIVFDKEHWRESLAELYNNPQRRRQFYELLLITVLGIVVCGGVGIFCVLLVTLLFGGGSIGIFLRMRTWFNKFRQTRVGMPKEVFA